MTKTPQRRLSPKRRHCLIVLCELALSAPEKNRFEIKGQMHYRISNEEAAEHIRCRPNEISELLRALRELGLIEGGCARLHITDAGWAEYASENPAVTTTSVSAQGADNSRGLRQPPQVRSFNRLQKYLAYDSLDGIPLIGKIAAGNTPFDDYIEYSYSVEDLANDEIPRLRFRDLEDMKVTARTYALEVEGSSLEHDGIYPEDIVIVETRDTMRATENDLIVAEYVLTPDEVRRKRERTGSTSVPSTGLALKYYHRRDPARAPAPERLGWLTEWETVNEYNFDCEVVRPVGLAIRIYRLDWRTIPIHPKTAR